MCACVCVYGNCPSPLCEGETEKTAVVCSQQLRTFSTRISDCSGWLPLFRTWLDILGPDVEADSSGSSVSMLLSLTNLPFTNWGQKWWQTFGMVNCEIRTICGRDLTSNICSYCAEFSILKKKMWTIAAVLSEFIFFLLHKIQISVDFNPSMPLRVLPAVCSNAGDHPQQFLTHASHVHGLPQTTRIHHNPTCLPSHTDTTIQCEFEMILKHFALEHTSSFIT